jgi:homospermidine synthase
VARGEQRRIHPTAGVSGHGAGPGEVSWAVRPRWVGAGPMSGLTRKKKRREEENRKWAGWRMRPKKLFGI